MMYKHKDYENINVEWEYLLPFEFRKLQSANPVCYLPLGTVEWHGEQNALGLDAIKAHALCVMAARKTGGIVHPPVYGGLGGLPYPATVVMEDEMTWQSNIVKPWIKKLCMEIHRQGFKAIVIVTGHYGHNQQIMVREIAANMSQRLQIPVLGNAEYWFAQKEGYWGDHAGIGETSVLMYLYPELVDRERILEDPDYGVDDVIYNGSSYELGKKYCDAITASLSKLGNRILKWDDNTLSKYIEAERSIINKQIKGWRDHGPWMAWGKMFKGQATEYSDLLLNEDFEGIIKWAKNLY